MVEPGCGEIPHIPGINLYSLIKYLNEKFDLPLLLIIGGLLTEDLLLDGEPMRVFTDIRLRSDVLALPDNVDVHAEPLFKVETSSDCR